MFQVQLVGLRLCVRSGKGWSWLYFTRRYVLDMLAVFINTENFTVYQ